MLIYTLAKHLFSSHLSFQVKVQQMENRSNTMYRRNRVYHPETTDDECTEQAPRKNNNGKNKKPMTSSSDESESSLNFNLCAGREGDHDKDAKKFSTVDLNPTELASIIDQFRYSLIIYVHGKKIGYHNLYTRLVRVLALLGPYQLVDLGLGFFLLNISEFLDYIMVLHKYPLSIPNY